ncbi:ester cyclase [Solihabitans fulvus]|uniref:Ester cyclase n=1 Tax=Solihabitans fulvus TaxID=1892852 RepID=A0A5B2XFK0_9PSEU|nr:ester cyclase [Solihabitans fulvus]KAA2262608.1 ester cyclase [Solihabitans fulvus]
MTADGVLPKPRAEFGAWVCEVFFDRIWNMADPDALDTLDEVAAPDLVFHIGNLPHARTLAEFKATVRLAKQGQPDLVYTANEVIVDGNVVALRLENVGTHLGDFVGVFPPTGRVLRLTALLVVRLDDDGRLAEVWQEGDFLDLLRQAGLVAPAGAGPLRQVGHALKNLVRGKRAGRR